MTAKRPRRAVPEIQVEIVRVETPNGWERVGAILLEMLDAPPPMDAERRASEHESMSQLLSTIDAARVLNLSVNRVRQLDSELKPSITPGGRRVYDAARVEALRVKREKAKAGK